MPCVFGLLRRARGTVWRAIMLALLLLALANPSLVEEQRRPQQDVALLVVDDTGSQTIGDRAAQREAAVETLQEQMSELRDLDVRLIRVGEEKLSPAGESTEGGTRLFRAIDQALPDVPSNRRAGRHLGPEGQGARTE